jgi:hypothetical protein
MAESDGIAEHLRRLRRDLDEQLENTDSSRGVTSKLVKKIQDLRVRTERATLERSDKDPSTS